jgi:dTDP-4-dehydrorhamnose 3,5-epimerase
LKFIPQVIPEIILIEPTIYQDKRGYFFEAFRQDLFSQIVGHNVNFIQDNESKSSKGVLRGLHYQVEPFTQTKLIRVIKGSVLDVVVDIRRESDTFGKHLSFKLTADNKNQLFVPSGFAHGFVALSSTAIFSYKVNNYYSPEHERGIAYDDKDLAIDWQLPDEVLQLSDRDLNNPSISELIDLL